MNIWQIQQELLSIFEELEENGGELNEELEQRLSISQEDFRSKIENYTNMIKVVKGEIATIDEETKRLDKLKKTKTAFIERLSKILINGIELFGDTTKSGSKVFDYGTGKVSIRNTQKVELDDDKVKTISKELYKALSFEAMMGAGSNRENFTFEDIIERCKEHKEYLENGNIVNAPEDITKEDIQNTVVEITFREHIQDLMKGEGFANIKNLFMYNHEVDFTPKIDKNQLKNEMKDTNNITIGKVVSNKTLVIK